MNLIESKYRNSEYPDTILCCNDTLKVYLILKPFDFDSHKIEYVNNPELNSLVINKDGEYPKGMMKLEYSRETCRGDREIKELVINIHKKRYTLPINVIKGYFNPHHMSVIMGSEGDMYIEIASGNDGEAYSIMLSVVNEKIVSSKPTEVC